MHSTGTAKITAVMDGLSTQRERETTEREEVREREQKRRRERKRQRKSIREKKKREKGKLFYLER